MGGDEIKRTLQIIMGRNLLLIAPIFMDIYKDIQKELVRLCLPDRRLHRQRSFCSESASLLRGVHRRLFGLQRRLRTAHEAGPLSGRPEHQERRQG